METSSFLQQAIQSMEDRRICKALLTLSPRKVTLLSESLNHLYSIGTCSANCRGGDHILEAIVGRCFNHCLGSLRLISDNLYDESLNLTRSVAEATNLLFLFNEEPKTLDAWKVAGRSERLKRFAPGKVRERLRDICGIVPVSDDAYQELCEVATHVTPDTRPNQHDANCIQVGNLGGIFQAEGHARAVEKLLLYCSLCSMIACQIFGYEDRLKRLSRLAENAFDA